jgi:ethanolamine-phosphate cytidylyltransferase
MQTFRANYKAIFQLDICVINNENSFKFQYVNEVVIGAPYSVTKDLMEHFKVDVVCHGQTVIALEACQQDPYSVPKTMGKFVLLDSG